MTDLTRMQEEATNRHQEVLSIIEGLSDTASLDRASTVWNVGYYSPHISLTLVQMSRTYSQSHNRYVVPSNPAIL
jgi:hypothetical protein